MSSRKTTSLAGSGTAVLDQPRCSFVLTDTSPPRPRGVLSGVTLSDVCGLLFHLETGDSVSFVSTIASLSSLQICTDRSDNLSAAKRKGGCSVSLSQVRASYKTTGTGVHEYPKLVPGLLRSVSFLDCRTL